MAGEFYLSNLVGDFDYQAYLDKLREVKMIPVQQIRQQEQLVSQKINALSQIHAKLKDFLGIASALTSDSTYEVLRASSSNTDVATVSVTGKPTEATYSVSVSQLAERSVYELKAASGSISDPDETISGSGTLTIDYKVNGETKTLEVDYTGKSLRDIADAINNSGNLTASIINTGTDSEPNYELLISSNETGNENAIVSITDSSSFFSAEEKIAAQDAVLTINGVTATSSSNTFDSLVEGLSITVKSTGDTEIKVSKSFSGLESKVEELLKAYNDLHDLISAATAKGQPLQGEYSIHTTERAIFNFITNSLGKLGIIDVEGDAETTKGHLTLNREAFEKLASENFDKLKESLKTLGNNLEDYINSYDITLSSTENRYRDVISSMEERARFMEELINKELESMRLQFARLETYLSEMKSLQARIESFAKSLTVNFKNK